MKQLERIFKGLANRCRLAIVRLLAQNKELPVAEIARRIHLSLTSTSKHLLILHQLDIAEKRQESLNVYYRLGDELPDAVKRVSFLISNSRE